MGAGTSIGGRVFGYFPVGIVLEVVVTIGKGNRDEGELELLGKPTRGSGDSSEDFVVVGGGKC